MDFKNKYTLELQGIVSDLNILKSSQIYENQNVPGIPKCSTVGRRLEE